MKPEEQRRLLELAAKAAGYSVVGRAPSGRLLISSDGCHGGVLWSPDNDDGDSRRLEVKLQATVLIGPSAVWVKIGHSVNVCEGYTEDPYAATRLAVLRAGAVVGEAMP